MARIFTALLELETNRLLLRKMRLGDAEAMFAYASDPEITRRGTPRGRRFVEESENFLRSAGEGYERGDFGGWGSFERMGFDRVEARCIVENAASARVMEKEGMSYECTLRSEYATDPRRRG